MVSDIVLVNEHDEEIGLMPKLEVHEKGILHRAFSVFIFNSKLELLLQKRTDHKYHSAGLWSNTCCSHPFPGEETSDAANRRLKEEMGITANLRFAFSFIYKAELDNGLIEHELDHIYYGKSDDIPVINPDEVSEYKYISLSDLARDMQASPEKYTEWFKICFDNVVGKILS